MALKCGKCGRVVPGSGIPRKCPGCGMTDIIRWSRVDDDIDPVKNAKDKAFLEGRRTL